MIKPTRRGTRRLLMAGGLGMTIVGAQIAMAAPAAASPMPTRSCGGSTDCMTTTGDIAAGAVVPWCPTSSPGVYVSNPAPGVEVFDNTNSGTSCSIVNGVVYL